MPWACPVCDTVEADAEHLANHLAVTASLHEGEHAAWLESHAPGWQEMSPDELGRVATDHAEKRDVEGSTHGHEHTGRPSRPPETVPDKMDSAGNGLDGETEEVLREARDLTRRAQEGSEEESRE
jgi:hypothetical protein